MGIAAAEMAPVKVENADGGAAVLLVCEHAARNIPPSYRDLGLAASARGSHIAWDPGAVEVARHLARRLGAPLVAGTVSRLVYDCNRPPEAPDAVPEASEEIPVPGNRGLSLEARAARVAEVYAPFRDRLAAEIARRRPKALVTIHSFTPVYLGQPRATEIGIVHDTDRRLADAMLERAEMLAPARVARNDPYGPADGVTHTLKVHGIANGLQNVMIEIRNDLIATADGQATIAARLHACLTEALIACGLTPAEAGCRA